MFNVVLVRPEIPPNTGNIGRLCLATRSTLHLVKPLGFSLNDRQLKRAGLDYWPYVDVHTYPNWRDFLSGRPPGRMLGFSAKATRSYTQIQYRTDDLLIFGSETRGLPNELLGANWPNCLKIPLLNPKVRSLNLATSVAMVLGEALRQTGLF